MNREELETKTVIQLKEIAKDLNLRISSKLTKSNIIDEILKETINVTIVEESFKSMDLKQKVQFALYYGFFQNNFNYQNEISLDELSKYISETQLYKYTMNFFFEDLKTKFISFNNNLLLFETDDCDAILQRLAYKVR